MPATISIVPQERLGVMRLTGEVDGVQLLASIRKFFESSAAAAGFGVVWDTRSISRLDVSPEEMQNVADVLDDLYARCPTMRWALIGRSDDAVALATLLLSSSVHLPRRLRIFDDLQCAWQWLSDGMEAQRRRLPSFAWMRLHRN